MSKIKFENLNFIKGIEDQKYNPADDFVIESNA